MNRSSVGIIVAILLAATQIRAQSSAVSGTIVDPKGKSVDSAVVTANLAPVSGAAGPNARNLRAITSKSGAFSFANMLPGTYRVCVQAPGTDLLDPCRWRIPVMIKVTAGQNVTGFRIALEQGVPLSIRIDDAAQLLDKNEGKTKGAHLSVGVWPGSKLFQAVPISGKDNKGRDHTVYVPKNEPIKVSVFSKAFRIAEPSQTAVRVTAATGTQVKFTVTGLGRQ